MVDPIEAVLQSGNHAEAVKLIQALDAQDPWTQLYWARLWEAKQDWQQAEVAYRSLLRQVEGPKLVLAARQGLERLQNQRTQARQQSIAEATSDPQKSELGVLILEPIAPVHKKEAAQAMAQVMNIDPYSALLILPSQEIRLYRSGAVGELEFYGQQLKDKGVSAFWLSLSKLQNVTVHLVSYLESIEGPVCTAAVHSEAHSAPQSISFNWADVARRVEGQLPLFEEVLDRDSRGRLQRKPKIHDHVKFCDLHIPQQNCILRLHDVAYQFNQGIRLETETPTDYPLAHPLNHSTVWANWRQLNQLLHQKLPHQPIRSGFDTFAETALEHPELLSKLHAHIDLFRREDSNWDPAFHLYSSLLFLKPLLV